MAPALARDPASSARRAPWPATRSATAAWLAVLLLPAGVAAQTPDADTASAWWGGIELGRAELRQTLAGVGSAAHGELAMAFRGGVAAGPHWRLGGELGGFTLEAGNLWDPSQGRAIAQYLALAEYHFARPGDGPFFRLAAGYASFWSNHPDEAGRSGTAAAAGFGYQFGRNDYGSFGATLGYAAGELDDLRYRGWQLGATWMSY